MNFIDLHIIEFDVFTTNQHYLKSLGIAKEEIIMLEAMSGLSMSLELIIDLYTFFENERKLEEEKKMVGDS